MQPTALLPTGLAVTTLTFLGEKSNSLRSGLSSNVLTTLIVCKCYFCVFFVVRSFSACSLLCTGWPLAIAHSWVKKGYYCTTIVFVCCLIFKFLLNLLADSVVNVWNKIITEDLATCSNTIQRKICAPCWLITANGSRTEMYAGRVACCPLVSHVEYASRALLRLEKRWDRQDGRTDGQTDGRQTVTLRFPLDTASAITDWLTEWLSSQNFHCVFEQLYG